MKLQVLSTVKLVQQEGSSLWLNSPRAQGTEQHSADDPDKLGVFFEISCLLNCTRIQRNEQIRKTNIFQKSAAFDINKSDSKKEDKTTKIIHEAKQKSP